MGDAEDIALAVLKGLATAVPSFASWLAGLLDGEPSPSAFSRRVRDILPERSASREAAERMAPP
jgi:hypothetical protein